MSITISLVIICKNEDRVIKRCIETIAEAATDNDEIIVIDTGSTDNTLNIISEFENVRVNQYTWNNDFAEARNFGISLSTKEWIFFIDSDEVLVEGSLENLRDTIGACIKTSMTNDIIVFSPKIVNTDDSVVYNAGRIIPNDNLVKFEGCVHEYPVVKDKKHKLVSLKTTDVVVKHDGYEKTIVKDKNKANRNTILIKKILNENPKNPRYYYFYYRDAKPLITEKEFEEGMLAFFEKFPNDPYSNQVARDLADHYIQTGKYNQAEKFIEMLFESSEKGNVEDHYSAIQLTGINEIQKTKEKQNDLLKLLIYSQENALNQKERIFENGYLFDDLIGILFFQLEEYQIAYNISKKLDSCNYSSHLSKMFLKLNIIDI